MDKYSVVTIDEKENELQKESASGINIRCPICNEDVLSDTNVPSCPIHGTEPFEKKKQD